MTPTTQLIEYLREFMALKIEQQDFGKASEIRDFKRKLEKGELYIYEPES